MTDMNGTALRQKNRFCRKVRFLGQNPKIGCQKFNDLQTAKLSKKQLCDRTLLAPFGLTRYDTDYWGAYTRHLDPDEHCPGKRHTQKIERKHLTLRTRIKRLARKTICFSKTTQMHDIVIGLFVNRYAFGRAV